MNKNRIWYLLLYLLLSFILTSCNDIPFLYKDQFFLYFKVANHELYWDSSWSKYTTQNEIFYWLNRNIAYREDETEEWANPEDTVKRGYGDCEDFAILYMNMAYFILNKKPSLALVETSSREFVEAGISNHAIVIQDGVMWAPEKSRIVDYPIVYKYSFDEVFRK